MTSDPQTPLTPPQPAQSAHTTKRLTKGHDKMLGGVASGLAEYLQVDPTLVRIAFVLIALLPGPAFLVYLAGWLILPGADSPAPAPSPTPTQAPPAPSPTPAADESTADESTGDEFASEDQ